MKLNLITSHFNLRSGLEYKEMYQGATTFIQIFQHLNLILIGADFQHLLSRDAFHTIGFILRVPMLNKLTKEQYFDDSHFWEISADLQTHHEEPKKMTVGDEKTVEAFVYDNSHTDTAQ